MNSRQTVKTIVGVCLALVGMTAGTLMARQATAPVPGRARVEIPPAGPQAGHPSGKLVIWGDMADMTRPGVALRCFATSRFKRGQRAGFRMTAIDGGTGEVENSAEMVVHIKYGGRTIDIPMRWRGVGSYPADEYLRAPTNMWTGVWEIPSDAMLGVFEYTVTAKDKFGRTAAFQPFPNHLSQLSVVE